MKSTKTVEAYGNTAKAKNRTTEKSGKSKFADPIAIKDKNPECKPEGGKGITWDYRCPPYDERSSNFVNAGTHYGVAHRQPVGHTGNPKQYADVMPMTRHNTLQDDDLG
jgi:hypothetical protein